ncbi:hypothetical protein C0V73_10210 [Rhizobium sp. TH135]|nr:hypothetical protein C0V73_10210 [Rhizobium sp. TH135]
MRESTAPHPPAATFSPRAGRRNQTAIACTWASPAQRAAIPSPRLRGEGQGEGQSQSKNACITTSTV